MAKNVVIFPTPQRSFGAPTPHKGFSATPFKLSTAPTPLKIAADAPSADVAGHAARSVAKNFGDSTTRRALGDVSNKGQQKLTSKPGALMPVEIKAKPTVEKKEKKPEPPAKFAGGAAGSNEDAHLTLLSRDIDECFSRYLHPPLHRAADFLSIEDILAAERRSPDVFLPEDTCAPALPPTFDDCIVELCEADLL
eukprot:m.225326 g.225326  ORF g.225326 m.225326 type:complete len:195 (-) comp16673_c0_seq1:456-1040(-)